MTSTNQKTLLMQVSQVNTSIPIYRVQIHWLWF